MPTSDWLIDQMPMRLAVWPSDQSHPTSHPVNTPLPLSRGNQERVRAGPCDSSPSWESHATHPHAHTYAQTHMRTHTHLNGWATCHLLPRRPGMQPHHNPARALEPGTSQVHCKNWKCAFNLIQRWSGINTWTSGMQGLNGLRWTGMPQMKHHWTGVNGRMNEWGDGINAWARMNK